MAFRKTAGCLILAGAAWAWKLSGIQELQLGPRSIHILTDKDSKLRLGPGEGYELAGSIPAEDLYAELRDRMDQRLVAKVGHVGPGQLSVSLPVQHLGRIAGSAGTLAFNSDSIVYSTLARRGSRTWRYQDIETITSLEKGFHFQ